MKIAMPVEGGRLCGHFGHAPEFQFVEVVDGEIKGVENHTPPPHEPGVLPRWLAEMGTTHIICGGIGARAVEILQQMGIQVVAGVRMPDPIEAVDALIKGTLSGSSGPTCDHHGHGAHHGGCSRQ